MLTLINNKTRYHLNNKPVYYSYMSSSEQNSTTQSVESNGPIEYEHIEPAKLVKSKIAQPDAKQIMPNMKKVSYDNIGLDVVLFNRTFTRNKGTLSQVVKSLSDMHDRLADPINDYQKGLYPQIRQECVSLVKAYEDIVGKVDKSDYNIFGYYLNGPQNNGKRRATAIKHELKSYGVSEYQETIRTIDDRLKHIKSNCLRKTFDTIGSDSDSGSGQEIYKRVIEFCDEFHKIITTHHAQWKIFMENYRSTNGITTNVFNNLKKNENKRRDLANKNPKFHKNSGDPNLGTKMKNTNTASN